MADNYHTNDAPAKRDDWETLGNQIVDAINDYVWKTGTINDRDGASPSGGELFLVTSGADIGKLYQYDGVDAIWERVDPDLEAFTTSGNENEVPKSDGSGGVTMGRINASEVSGYIEDLATEGADGKVPVADGSGSLTMKEVQSGEVVDGVYEVGDYQIAGVEQQTTGMVEDWSQPSASDFETTTTTGAGTLSIDNAAGTVTADDTGGTTQRTDYLSESHPNSTDFEIKEGASLSADVEFKSGSGTGGGLHIVHGTYEAIIMVGSEIHPDANNDGVFVFDDLSGNPAATYDLGDTSTVVTDASFTIEVTEWTQGSISIRVLDSDDNVLVEDTGISMTAALDSDQGKGVGTGVYGGHIILHEVSGEALDILSKSTPKSHGGSHGRGGSDEVDITGYTGTIYRTTSTATNPDGEATDVDLDASNYDDDAIAYATDTGDFLYKSGGSSNPTWNHMARATPRLHGSEEHSEAYAADPHDNTAHSEEYVTTTGWEHVIPSTIDHGESHSISTAYDSILAYNNADGFNLDISTSLNQGAVVEVDNTEGGTIEVTFPSGQSWTVPIGERWTFIKGEGGSSAWNALNYLDASAINHDNLTGYVGTEHRTILQTTAANRPAAGTEGRIFLETDTGRTLYDDGASWVEVGLTDSEISLANLGSRSHKDLSDAPSGAHHTRPSAGTLLTDDADTFNVDEGSIDHDALTNYVSDEHREIIVDLDGNRPAAGTEGRLFVDTANLLIQRDTGSSWETVASVDNYGFEYGGFSLGTGETITADNTWYAVPWNNTQGDDPEGLLGTGDGIEVVRDMEIGATMEIVDNGSGYSGDVEVMVGDSTQSEYVWQETVALGETFKLPDVIVDSTIYGYSHINVHVRSASSTSNSFDVDVTGNVGTPAFYYKSIQ